MDFKSMLNQLSQLSEATKETEKGRVHKAEPGGYGRKFDTDEEGEEKKEKKPEAPKKRGRPPATGEHSAEEKKKAKDRDEAGKKLQSFMVGNKPKDFDKKKGTVIKGKAQSDSDKKKKKSVKEWVEEIEQKYIAEAAPGQQLTVKPMPGAAQLVDPATQKVMATGDAAAIKNMQGAVAQGKVQMRGSQEMAEGDEDYSAKKARAGQDIGKPGKQFAQIAKKAGEKYGSAERGKKVAGAVLAKLRKTNEGEIPHESGIDNIGAGLGAGRSATTLEAKEDKKAMKKDHKAEKEGKKVTKDMEKVEEAAKPDYIDLDKDGNKKESMKKAAADKKKKVNESMHKHSAARLMGKAHALAKEGYNCKYDDMEEAHMYHEGYKEGLDECYGQEPIVGLVKENPPATVPGMADQAVDEAVRGMMWHEQPKNAQGPAFKVGLPQTQAQRDAVAAQYKAQRAANRGVTATDAYGNRVTPQSGALSTQSRVPHSGPSAGAVPAQDPRERGLRDIAGAGKGVREDDMMEMDKTEWMKHKAQSTPGGTFKAFGQTMKDSDVLDEFAFESWDKELNSLLTESEQVDEGMTVSISKGQQGAPDSVSVSAQDGEADALLGLIKQAGLGLFGDESGQMPAGPDTLMQKQGGINVVGDHDGMMALIKKVAGGEESDQDYEDEEGHDEGHDEGHEEHEHTDEETCNECGYMESQCGCDKEMVDEVESEDQMAYEVAEDNAPDSGAAETTADEEAEAQEDAALAKADELKEWANGIGGKGKDAEGKGTDASFEQDIEFMTKFIAGGLNKPKSTGQTTIPVIAGQDTRMEDPMAWARLAGIKK